MLQSLLRPLLQPATRSPFDPAPGNAVGGPPVYDYYVNAATGNDANAGDLAAPWKSLSKISGALSAGNVRSVLVKSGTYSTALDYVTVAPGSISTATELNVTFEAGCIMDGTAANAIAPTNGWEASGSAWTLRIYGNGLTVRNYAEPTGLSPNGFGNRGSQKMYIYNVAVTNCDDGFSAHEAAHMYTYDCTVNNGEKSAFLHVDTAYVEHWRTVFTVTTGTNGAGSGTPTIKIYDSQINPATSGLSLSLPGATVERTRLGTLTNRINIVCTVASATINDCYVNAYMDGNSQALLTRCFGRFSSRQRNAANAGIRLRNCVFVNGAAGETDSAIFASFDAGSQNAWNAQDCVLSGYATAVGNGFSATFAGYFVAAGSYVRNCCLFGNTTNIDADLTAAGADITGTVTGNPLIGAANTYVQSDYGYTAGSPCIGAGVGGGNIGFAA